MRHTVLVALVASLVVSGLHAGQFSGGPDAAVGSPEDRLASAIEFDSTGAFAPGQGFTARVRLSWKGTAALKSRVVYGETKAADLPERAFLDAARSAFYNFSVTGARVDPGPAVLPVAVEYDVREAMSFGSAGRPWTFYVPVPRVMHRLPPSAGQLQVGEVGRWTVRARYTLADGMFAAAPRGRRIETDFAVFASTYAVEGRELVLERTFQLKALTLPPGREAELQALYAAVESDRPLTFAITPYPPGAPTAADRLNEQGLQALDARDPERAADLFRQAVAADPRHRWALCNLADAQLRLKQAAAAIESSRSALANDAGNPAVRLTLGQALESAGRFDEAEKVLLEQVERLPWSAWSLDALARFYAGRNRPLDAVRFWQRAVDAAPRAEPIVLALGTTLLDMGRTADAAAAWRKGLEPTRDPFALNGAAWALAERGVELGAARELIERGLDLFARGSLGSAPPDPAVRQQITSQVGALWDTTGWIEFKAGRIEAAIPWLQAAWQQSQRADVAEHLGDALAAARRIDEAARAYADGLAREPGRASASAKLAAIAGAPSPDPKTTELAMEHGRTLSLSPGPAPAWTGDVGLAHDRTGAVREIVVAGSAPTGVLDALRSARVPFVAPPDRRDYRFDRRVTVTCPGGNAACSAVWR